MRFDETRNAIMARTAALDADKFLGRLAAHAVNRPVGDWDGTSLSLSEATARGLVRALRSLRQCRAKARAAGDGDAANVGRMPPGAA
ncbi:MAG: hypothetical protein RDU30_09730 [Desulfovibrionaceae bacterium]|nr:hypothetical protein [Desulfovibrionaceae bacterium]